MDFRRFPAVLDDVAADAADSSVNAALFVNVPVLPSAVAGAVVGVAAVAGFKVQTRVKQGLGPPAFVVGTHHGVVFIRALIRGAIVPSPHGVCSLHISKGIGIHFD